MAGLPTVAAFDVLALIASELPSLNAPTPIYAIVASDTFFPLTIPSSWGEFDVKYEYALSDYPTEQGGFGVFNKVRRPSSIDVTLVKTGSDLARFAWLAAIQQMQANNPLQLYTLISPQGIYLDFTIGRMSHDTRADKGSNMLYLTLTFVEIPQIASSVDGLSNTADAKSGPIEQIGRLFTRAATAAETALINIGNFLTS